MVGDSLVSWMIFVYSKALGQEMATQLYNHGLSDHGLTVEPFDFDPVQDPELQEEVSVDEIQKIWGLYPSSQVRRRSEFSLPQTKRGRRSRFGLMPRISLASPLCRAQMRSTI